MEKKEGFISLFLKGILIGIANMIAGISGGTIAFITGIYEPMVKSLANLTKKFGSNFLYLIKIFLGVAVGFLGASRLLDLAFSHILLEMICLFSGILLGGMYNDKNEYITIYKTGKKKTYIIAFLIAFLAIILLTIVNQILITSEIGEDIQRNNERWTDVSIWQMLTLFFAIAFGATAMIFPGISGSLCFMVFGIYYPVLNAMSDITVFSKYQDPVFVLDILKIMIPLIIGGALSLIFISKPISRAFERHRDICMYLIFGFLTASIISMFILNFHDIELQFKWWHLLSGLFLFLPFGFFSSRFLHLAQLKLQKRREEKKAHKEEQDIIENNEEVQNQ
ncbi:DUF368 domain-containing protein [bacterium]|nr:DUF368 domain-containing protein [bacterium]